MSTKPESNPIPPEREFAFLRHAEEQVNLAAEPVMREVGHAAIADLEKMLVMDEQAPALVEAIEGFVAENDLHANHVAGIDNMRESYIAEDAESYVNYIGMKWKRIPRVGPVAAADKYWDEIVQKKSSYDLTQLTSTPSSKEAAEMLQRGDDLAIREATTRKPRVPIEDFPEIPPETE